MRAKTMSLCTCVSVGVEEEEGPGSSSSSSSSSSSGAAAAAAPPPPPVTTACKDRTVCFVLLVLFLVLHPGGPELCLLEPLMYAASMLSVSLSRSEPSFPAAAGGGFESVSVSDSDSGSAVGRGTTGGGGRLFFREDPWLAACPAAAVLRSGGG